MIVISSLLIPTTLLCLASTFTATHGLGTMPVTHDKDETTHHFVDVRLGSFADPKSINAKRGVCDGYDGILKINSGDDWAATGTVFFVYAVSQLIYADENNLIPWVFYEWGDSKVYDDKVHTEAPLNDNGERIKFKALEGGWFEWHEGNGCPFPGKPDYENPKFVRTEYTIDSSGVWENYFKPVSAFQPKHFKANDIASCEFKPLLRFQKHAIWPGVHSCAPWGLRAWPYEELPARNGPNWDEEMAAYKWMGSMRQRANQIVAKYFHPQPWLETRINEANPIRESDPPCLAIHSRHTDKGNGRRKVPLEEMQPFAEAFVDNGGEVIYVAGDSEYTFDHIAKKWPKKISDRVRNQKGVKLTTGQPVFESTRHHRSNTEALIDIYAMSRCGLFLHGYSAMAEGAFYINDDLHDYSVNFEDHYHPTVAQFEEMVRHLIRRK